MTVAKGLGRWELSLRSILWAAKSPLSASYRPTVQLRFATSPRASAVVLPDRLIPARSAWTDLHRRFRVHCGVKKSTMNTATAIAAGESTRRATFVELTDLGEESSPEITDHIDVAAKTRSGDVVTADINVGVASQGIRSSADRGERQRVTSEVS